MPFLSRPASFFRSDCILIQVYLSIYLYKYKIICCRCKRIKQTKRTCPSMEVRGTCNGGGCKKEQGRQKVHGKANKQWQYGVACKRITTTKERKGSRAERPRNTQRVTVRTGTVKVESISWLVSWEMTRHVRCSTVRMVHFQFSRSPKQSTDVLTHTFFN